MEESSTTPEIIHSLDDVVKELLFVQALARKSYEAYKERYLRQQDELNAEIDLHQKNIKSLKSKLI